MINLRAAAVGLGLAALLIPRSGHSQIPTFQSQAEVASSLQLVPVDSIPDFGTFFLLSGQLDESLPSIPLPYDLYHGTEPVYALDAARGTFAGGNGCGLPIDSGVILSSGDITNAIGPNDNSMAETTFYSDGDRDLEKLVGTNGTTCDAAVLEFDIISTNSFILQFQYIYASEEYPEWIGQYNDPMAIFVSTNRVGTNWINSITNDIALVPGTTNVPVGVNNINGGCVGDAHTNYVSSPTNPQYYMDNHDPDLSAVPPYAVAAPVFNIQYDGTTVLLTAQKLISANVTNHIKIAIADYKDADYDSAVFIKTWSPCQCP